MLRLTRLADAFGDGSWPAPLAVVAGSGLCLDPLLDTVFARVPFREIAGLAPAGVAGHAGEFVAGTCAGWPVVLQRGRLHVYEGLDVLDVVRPLELLREAGVRTVLLTNAVGGLLSGMRPGDLMAVDGVDLWPFRRWAGQPVRLAPDRVVDGCAWRGRYVWVHGPSYETRAEISAMARSGGAAVGMSAGPELWRCRQLGLSAAVVSCVTNNCLSGAPVLHEEVLAAGRRASAHLVACVRAWLTEAEADGRAP